MSPARGVGEDADEGVDAVAEQAGELAALLPLGAGDQVLGEKREVGLRLQQEEDAEAVALVGVQCLDGGGHGDGAHHRVAGLHLAGLCTRSGRP